MSTIQDALKVAGQQFRHYEQLHAAKGTPDGDAKAQTNAQMAEMCEAALTGALASETDDNWEVQAALNTSRACGYFIPPDSGKSERGRGVGHAYWMLAEITYSRVTGRKAHRWLGYAQGILVDRAILSLEEAKVANMQASACKAGKHSWTEHPSPTPEQEGKEFCELCPAERPAEKHGNVIHKINAALESVCGRVSTKSSLYWSNTDCPACLALKPADTAERTSIKRSHRAEGNNFVD